MVAMSRTQMENTNCTYKDITMCWVFCYKGRYWESVCVCGGGGGGECKSYMLRGFVTEKKGGTLNGLL